MTFIDLSLQDQTTVRSSNRPKPLSNSAITPTISSTNAGTCRYNNWQKL